MGVDISGALLIGCHYSKLNDVPDDLWEDEDMRIFAQYYDGVGDGAYHIGFKIENVPVSQMHEQWFDRIKTLADEFKRLTGVDAELIGCQHIW